jgi:hypothetical protein
MSNHMKNYTCCKSLSKPSDTTPRNARQAWHPNLRLHRFLHSLDPGTRRQLWSSSGPTARDLNEETKSAGKTHMFKILFDHVWCFFDQTHIYRKFLGWFMFGLTTLRLRIGMLMLSFKFSQSLNPAIHRLWNASPACLSSLDSGCWNDGIITRWCPPSYVCWFIIPLTSSIYLP